MCVNQLALICVVLTFLLENLNLDLFEVSAGNLIFLAMLMKLRMEREIRNRIYSHPILIMKEDSIFLYSEEAQAFL